LRPAAVGPEAFFARIAPDAEDEPTCISTPGVVNAASFLHQPVAPGEIITIFGKGIGPAQLAMGELVDGERFATSVAGVRVLFDGVPSPLIYVFQTVISAIVPYSVDGKQSTSVQVEYSGNTSNTVTLPVAASAPGIFSSDSSGRGLGAILHPDYSRVNPDNPAHPGDVILLFTTGEGQTTPPGVDGQLALSTYPTPVLPVSVRIGGIECVLQYWGAAPTLVAGVMQINVFIPENVVPGDEVPIILKVGDRISQPGLTVAIE
ncbi:MAG: hypothetical protein JXB13_10390, partial [Phycisphaerae bacterium]|nr:hypothetical protein [Phycisphaerae bacterium]